MNDNLLKSDIFIKEREIDLKDMLYYICRKWRGLLLATVSIMVLLVLFKIPALTQLNGVVMVLKQLSKYAIIGAFVGLILMCFLYAVLYVVGGKIKSENEFRANCSLNIIGVLPEKGGKKLNGMDRLVRRLFGVDRRVEDFDALIWRRVEEIKIILSVVNVEQPAEKGDLCIGVVSTESDETASELTDLFKTKLNGTIKVVAAGNILKNAESVRVVMESDVVLMTERIASSNYQMIEESYKKLDMWEKKVIGIVLMDGDAR